MIFFFHYRLFYVLLAMMVPHQIVNLMCGCCFKGETIRGFLFGFYKTQFEKTSFKSRRSLSSPSLLFCKNGSLSQMRLIFLVRWCGLKLQKGYSRKRNGRKFRGCCSFFTSSIYAASSGYILPKIYLKSSPQKKG